MPMPMPRRSRRLSPPRLPLLLFALWLLAAASSSTPQSLASPAGSSASSQEAPASPRGKTVTVGGHSVKVGDEIAPGSFGSVYSATDENGKTVVYKKLNSNSKWGAEEIPATKAAGQYIAHDDKGMVQHKVGTTGMKEYLEDKKKNPGGWVPYSDEIARQLKKQQEKAGYTHNDIKAANIRVDTTKTKKSGAPKFQLVDWGYAKNMKDLGPDRVEQRMELADTKIMKECLRQGFSRGGGGLHRRGPSSCAGVSTPAKASGGGAAAKGGAGRSAKPEAAVKKPPAAASSPAKKKK